MKIKSYLLGAALMVATFTATAQAVADNDPSRGTVLHYDLLASQATENGTATDAQFGEAAIGFGYVNGVVDTLNIYKVICIPQGVTRAQNMHIIQKYMDDHPTQWQYGSVVLITAAFRAAFPCQSK